MSFDASKKLLSNLILVFFFAHSLYSKSSNSSPIVKKASLITHSLVPNSAPSVSSEYSLAPIKIEPVKINKKLKFQSKRSFEVNKFDPQLTVINNFLPEGFFTLNRNLEDSIQNQASRLDSLIRYLEDNNNFVDHLDPEIPYKLPVGIKRDIGGTSFYVILDEVSGDINEALFNAFLYFQPPQSSQPLILYGRDLKFAASGGFIEGKLELLTTFVINENGQTQLELKAGDPNNPGTVESGTYAIIDCNGFRELHVEADIVFSRNLIVPEDSLGNVISTGNVRASIETTLLDWNDLLVSINLPAFQLPNLKGFSFSVMDAVLDFSDMKNAPATQFPADYINNYYNGVNPSLWRGVYIREFMVKVPPQISQRGDTSRIGFVGYDILVDSRGFSGRLAAENLLPIEKGQIGNWAFSVDTLSISLVANQLTEGRLAGSILLPVTEGEKENELGYYALVQPDNRYEFRVITRSEIEFDIWGAAQGALYENSTIRIVVDEGKFKPSANLSGWMSVNVGVNSENGTPDVDTKKNFSIARLEFQELQIQSVRPYVQIRSFSLGTDSTKFNNLPVTINEIYGSQQDDILTLGVKFRINLSPVVAGDGGIEIRSRNFEDNKGDLRYRFDRLDISRIGVEVTQGPIQFKGLIDFFRNDREYGTGFQGLVMAKFGVFGQSLGIEANALFGRTDEFRYWYVDALGEFDPGLPAGPVGIEKLGGGAYYHMSMSGSGRPGTIGVTSTGIKYVPNGNAGVGFKATVGLSIGTESLISADVTYEMSFYVGGGVRYISFQGNGYLLSPPEPPGILAAVKEKVQKLADVLDKYRIPGEADPNLNANQDDMVANEEIYGALNGPDKKSAFSAHIYLLFDFENRTFHGNFKAYLNLVVIKGRGPGGLLGEIVVHSGPEDWYIYIGRPEYDRRIGISVLSLAEFGGYFVAGTKIPGSPPPPPQVSSILGDIDLDYTKDLNALANGGGFGFGADLQVDTGNIGFLIFYARFYAGLGFDVMLRKFNNIQCKGEEGPIGINGWYANGQAYAYIGGEIGIQVRFFRKRRRFPILEIAAAVVLQAKLPNPSWFRGVVGGRFRVLGGLIKGNVRFQFTIGKECELIEGGSVVEGLEILAQTTPSDGNNDISVFASPQAIFNYAINKPFELVDLDGQLKSFRINLDYITLKANGQELPGDLEWNNDLNVLAFNPFDIFPGEQLIEMSVQISFEERKDGVWEEVIVDDEVVVEKSDITFTTEKAPDYIPVNNVSYSYPMRDQYNFYWRENATGYIQLKQGQPNLFQPQDDWDLVGRFVSYSGNRYPFNISYSNSTKEITFDVPNNLAGGQIMLIELVYIPSSTGGNIDSNVDTVTSTVTLGDQSNYEEQSTTEIRKQEAEGIIEALEERLVYTSSLRTSQYPTLAAKIQSTNPSSGWRRPILPGVHEIGSNLFGTEPFDQLEILGDGNIQPLIQIEASLVNNPWYNNTIYPLVYRDYPLANSIEIENRNINFLGLPPTKAVYLVQDPNTIQLTEDEIANGAVNPQSFARIVLNQVNYEIYLDYVDLQGQVANYAVNNTIDSRLRYILETPYPIINRGNYKVQINYVLPGKNEVSSTYDLIINNAIGNDY